jgi:FHA domain-containing protein
MGRLRRRDTTGFHELTAETSVGRAAGSSLRLARSHVSLQHASMRWTERGTWELRDLQSKNGTYIDGQRAAAGVPVKLELGSEIAFGSASDAFVMEDVSPPRPMLVRIDGEAEPILLQQGLVALPSLEDPIVSLFRGESGQWHVESRERVGPLSDGDWITIGNEHWRCCLPTTPDETEVLGGIAGLFALAEVELRLVVSHDEEQVDLTLIANGREVRLGQKACHYLLLTLARCRTGRDLPSAASVVDGWVSVSGLLDLLRVSEQRLNVDIFRIRQELKAAGVVDAVSVIERDPQLRRLRLGTDRVLLAKAAAGPDAPSSEPVS